jgi:hypothetical protein
VGIVNRGVVRVVVQMGIAVAVMIATSGHVRRGRLNPVIVGGHVPNNVAVDHRRNDAIWIADRQRQRHPPCLSR